MFCVEVFETRQTYLLNRLQVWKITDVQEMTTDFDEDMSSSGTPTPPVDSPQQSQQDVPSKKHFVSPTNSDDVDNLAAERQAKETVTQTKWVVKIFRGKII